MPKDPEWNELAASNAGGDGALLFGRVTYEMMAGFWPTPAATEMMPEVASGMNRMPKFVFSRTLPKASWQNTTLLKGDLLAEVRKLKEMPGPGIAILGSGTIVSQLTAAWPDRRASARGQPDRSRPRPDALRRGVTRKIELKRTGSGRSPMAMWC